MIHSIPILQKSVARKLFWCTLVCCLMGLLPHSQLWAQRRMAQSNILELIEQKESDNDVVSVTLGAKVLRKHDISFYKSILFKKPTSRIQQEIQAALNKDRALSNKIREQIDNGEITSCYYQLKTKDRQTNYYVLYKKNKKTRIIIYLEGGITQDQLLDILESE